MTGIADDILIVGYDSNGADHDITLQGTTNIRKEGLKLNIGKCYFRCTTGPFFGEIISWQGMRSGLRKLRALTSMQPPSHRRNSMHFFVH